MALFTNDTFTDTDSTLLQNHTGETGASWSKVAGPVDFKVKSNRIYADDTTDGSNTYYLPSGTVDVADYKAVVEMYYAGSLSGSQFGVLLRCNADASSLYFLGYENAAPYTNEWQIWKYTASTWTNLGHAAQTLTAGQTYTIKAQIIGSRLRLIVDDVEKVVANDTSITAAGKAGLCIVYGTATTGFHANSFLYRSHYAAFAGSTLWLTSADINAGVFDLLVDYTPSSLDESSGWTVDKKASPNYSVYYPNTIRAASTFATTEPSSYSQRGYRSDLKFKGQFASGNWQLNFKVKSNTYYAQTGQAKLRIWRSSNTDGSSATQVTSGWIASSTISFTAANQYQTGSITFDPGGISLNDEYLFLEIEWSAITSGGNNSAQVLWVHNEGTAEKLTTTTFTLSSTYEVTTTISATSGATLASNATFNSGFSIAATSGIADNNLATLLSLLALTATAGTTENANATFVDNVVGLSITPGESIISSMGYNVLASLSATAGITNNSLLTLGGIVALAAASGISNDIVATLISSMNLGGTAGIIDSANTEISKGVSLAAISGTNTNAVNNLLAAIAVATNTNISAGAVQTMFGGLSLDVLAAIETSFPEAVISVVKLVLAGKVADAQLLEKLAICLLVGKAATVAFEGKTASVNLAKKDSEA